MPASEQVAITIESLLKEQGLWPEAMRWAAIGVWDEAVGEKVASHARPFAVSAGCLMVAVAAWCCPPAAMIRGSSHEVVRCRGQGLK